MIYIRCALERSARHPIDLLKCLFLRKEEKHAKKEKEKMREHLQLYSSRRHTFNSFHHLLAEEPSDENDETGSTSFTNAKHSIKTVERRPVWIVR